MHHVYNYRLFKEFYQF